jgi:SprT protein
MRSVTKEEFLVVLQRYFPVEAIPFVMRFIGNYQFKFVISSPRISKKGDFRFRIDGKRIPSISVNRDLGKYEFLLVFIHELAHFFVYVNSPYFVKSHGEEWKNQYKNLSLQLMEEISLPQDIERAWRQHLSRIKSSSALDEELVTIFKKYKKENLNECMLKELHNGDCFFFRKELFRLDSFARTRATCTLLRTNRRYIIGGTAEVIRASSCC